MYKRVLKAIKTLAAMKELVEETHIATPFQDPPFLFPSLAENGEYGEEDMEN